MDNRTWNAMNSMNSSFAPKRSKNFGREKESTNSVKIYDEVFIWLNHFVKRYLDKLVDEQCHRNAKQLGKHIEYT